MASAWPRTAIVHVPAPANPRRSARRRRRLRASGGSVYAPRITTARSGVRLGVRACCGPLAGRVVRRLRCCALYKIRSGLLPQYSQSTGAHAILKLREKPPIVVAAIVVAPRAPGEALRHLCAACAADARRRARAPRPAATDVRPRASRTPASPRTIHAAAAASPRPFSADATQTWARPRRRSAARPRPPSAPSRTVR